MKVLVYVEGPSDRDALRSLLRSVIAEGQRRGVGIQLLPLGDKAKILDTSAGKAARHLAEHPQDWVVALPDLYPMAQYDGTPNEHRSFADLERLLTERFARDARRHRVAAQAQAHFRVHCLKHDLEVLLLACPDQLRRRLGTDHALGQWRSPVEDQNDQQPPKRIVEALFKKYRSKPGYVETVDAPWILERASLEAVVATCPQRIAPFVAELRRIAETGGDP
jgi:hypothetical protein